MKMTMALIFLCVLAASLPSSGGAVQFHHRYRPHHHGELTAPSRIVTFSPWEKVSPYVDAFENFIDDLDIAPYLDGLQTAFDNSFFKGALAQPDEGEGQELIKKSCSNRSHRKSNDIPGNSARPALKYQSAFYGEQPIDLSQWETEQIQQWEQDYRNRQAEWETQQQAKKQQFLRQLEAKKKARVEQEKAQRMLQEQQRVAREERARIDRQTHEHQLLIKEAEKQRDLAEKKLRDLRSSVKRKSDFSLPEDSKKPEAVPSPQKISRQRPIGKSYLARMEETELPNHPTEILSLFVSGYKPHEISVKLDGNKVRIQGRHASNNEESGWLVSEFDRTYVLPDGVDSSTVRATFNKDAVLKIEAIQSSGPALLSGQVADDIDMEHSSVVTKDDKSIRELRINGLDSSSPHADQIIQHSIHRNTQTEDIDDDGVTIDVLEDY